MGSVIKIKALSKRNGWTICMASLIGLFITAFYLPANLSLIDSTIVSVMFLIFTTGIGIGVIKILEPEYSIRLDDIGMIYNHQRGQWKVKWRDIQRVDLATFTSGIDNKQLPYIGIRLNSSAFLLNNISPRLASFLLIEQKELVTFALRDDFANWQCADGQCPTEAMFEFKDVEMEGQTLTGLIAMFYHRLQLLRQKLGYDLYLPVSAIDRDPEEFVKLLRKLKSDVFSNNFESH